MNSRTDTAIRLGMEINDLLSQCEPSVRGAAMAYVLAHFAMAYPPGKRADEMTHVMASAERMLDVLLRAEEGCVGHA